MQQIRRRRAEVIQQWAQKRQEELKLKQAQSTLTDGNMQTFSVNWRGVPKIYTLISWNVVLFEESKSLRNPFVNKVINKVLSLLEADVCFLLETKDRPCTNMTAIEYQVSNALDWKDPEDDIDIGEDFDEEPLTLDEIEHLADEPLTYQQIGSELTGKVYRPPPRIYLYNLAFSKELEPMLVHDAIKALEKKEKEAKQKGKNLTKKQASKLATQRKKLEKGLAGLDKPLYLKAAKATSDEIKFAKEYNFFPKVQKKFCVNEQSGLAHQEWKLLYKNWDVFRHYYSIHLMRDDRSLTDITTDNDFDNILAQHEGRVVFRLRECLVCNEKYGYGRNCANQVCNESGPYTTALANLNEFLDTATFNLCYPGVVQETYGVMVKPGAKALGMQIYADEKMAMVNRASCRLLMYSPPPIATVKSNQPLTQGQMYGNLLGYQEKTSAFYGRCPFLMPVELLLPDSKNFVRVPVVSFHAPYGNSDGAGIQARADAMREVLKGDVDNIIVDNLGVQQLDANQKPQKAPLLKSAYGLVMGDFNLKYNPTTSSTQQDFLIANKLYEDFNSVGFKPMIPGVATSLTSLEEVFKRKIGDDTANYTSSAYDNFFAKGQALQEAIITAAAIDVPFYIKKHIGEFPLPAGDDDEARFSKLSDMEKAFYIYRRFVSDHLPIICDILVEPMDNSYKQSLEKEVFKQKIGNILQTQPIEMFLEHQGLVDLTTIDKPEWNIIEYGINHEKKVETASLTGVVSAVAETPQWLVLTVISRLNPTNMVYTRIPVPKQLSQHYQPGTHLRATVVNPKLS
jgi:hypothetical protein